MKQVLLLGTLLGMLSSCSTLVPPAGIKRDLIPVSAEIKGSIVGSVRVEVLATTREAAQDNTPYDLLLSAAQKEHGKTVDVVSVKRDKVTLTTAEKLALFKEYKKTYACRFVYNALVVKY